MNEFIKCKHCNVEICKADKCTFAISRRLIKGKEYFFCCEAHAREFEKKER